MRLVKILLLLLFPTLLLLLQGCAMVAVSGAATGVAVATDRRTTGSIVDDQTIEIKALHALAQNKPLWKESHINIISYNNMILLVGQTPTEDYKQQAANAVKDIPKVRRVYNELTIGEPIPISTRTHDSWITTKIKAKMAGSKEIKMTRVKVITEDGVVYLLGLTTPEEQVTATEIAQDVSGVQKIVQIFEPIEARDHNHSKPTHNSEEPLNDLNKKSFKNSSMEESNFEEPVNASAMSMPIPPQNEESMQVSDELNVANE